MAKRKHVKPNPRKKPTRKKPKKQIKRSPPKRKPKKASRPRGRPKKFLDLKEVCRLAGFGMPQAAIASTLGVSTRKLAKEKSENPEFAEAFDKAVREGAGTWEVDVSTSMLKAIKKGHTGPLLWAAELIQKKHGDQIGENPLLLEIPLADGSMLYVTEGMDPIRAIQHAENILKLPDWEFPNRDDS